MIAVEEKTTGFFEVIVVFVVFRTFVVIGFVIVAVVIVAVVGFDGVIVVVVDVAIDDGTVFVLRRKTVFGFCSTVDVVVVVVVVVVKAFFGFLETWPAIVVEFEIVDNLPVSEVIIPRIASDAVIIEAFEVDVEFATVVVKVVVVDTAELEFCALIPLSLINSL